ncbi:MAG: T9SS type A sorting domain-containing protein, partial [Thermoanaerobaculia bacterium]|nr:T9SS type A sorting domain-containing protein [Thermoanaerobaculia bacterium]
VDVNHYITPESDLEFLIQFQNTGTDTVQQVIVRDTLSPWLDPSTVHPGAASHPYDFDVYGNGIVQFTLPNANLLPQGSSANEGYVKFRVSQKPEVPCKTKIFNSAAIYFDFNAPVQTNLTFHTVCTQDSFLFVPVIDPRFPNANVKVYPNPFDESTTFEISGVQVPGFRLEVYDLIGRNIFNQSYSSPTFRLSRHHLPAGILIYRLTTDKGRPVASGKLLVR